MTSLQPSSARYTAPSRLLALQTLLAVERQHCFADDAFATFAARAKLSHEDQAWLLSSCTGCSATGRRWIGN